MAFKDILVHVDNTDSGEARIKIALAITDKFDAHLTGLYIHNPIELPVYAEVSIPQSVFDEAKDLDQDNLQTAKKRFNRLTNELGHNIEWREDEGRIAVKLIEYSLLFDLVVVGQSKEGSDADGGVADRLVLASGRPLLVVPHANPGTGEFNRVIVAWNAKREAVRAIHDALPLLKCASAVSVVSIKAPQQEDIPCADIAKHLARHGVKVELDETDEDVIDVGYWLQSHIESFGADMVVMGAYGHSRYREMIFGGVTRHMLRSMKVPCFMSH